MNLKPKYFIIAGVAVFALAMMSFASAKASQVKLLAEKLTVGIGGIRNFGTQLLRTYFTLDLVLKNPTAEHFSQSTGGLITAKVLRLYSGQKMIAFASLNHINKIDLPAGGKFDLKGIQIEISNIELGGELVNTFTNGNGITALLDKQTFQNVKNMEYIMSLINNFTYEVDIEVVGYTYVLRGKLG